jgi:hypothetical protein
VGRGAHREIWAVVVLLAVVGVQARPASAEQWHELYGDGLTALRNGQARRAVELLQRAIEERPRPGTLVPTYGTNFEPEYFPYLRLAEAHLLLEEGEAALEALETSAHFGVAPAGERAALEDRARALIDAREPSSPPASPPEPLGAAEPSAPPRPEPTPPAQPPSVAETRPATESADAPPPSGEAAPAPSPTEGSKTVVRPTTPPTVEARVRSRRVPASAPPTSPALVVTSDPPGARVFLDDSPVGRTDPETGRLRLTDLGPGRHRVRVSLEDREDVIREVEIAEEPVTVDARLTRRPSSPPPVPGEPEPPPARQIPPGLLVGVGAVVVLAIGVLLWSLTRKGRIPAVSDETPSMVRGRGEAGTDESFPMPFGDYSLVRRLGKGGMAVVYEATRGGRTVALKRPLAGFLDDDRFRERFLREAELGRTLHHPNIVRILDRGQVGRTPYLTMELVVGETLTARLDREGRLDVPQAVHLTAQVAEALDYAHSKGVIHRDLKPSNIMIETAGMVRVMDYGIARAQHLEGLTTTGSFLGTPSYAAPETVEAASQPASDLYSLGVVLFEMLTGSLPFGGDTAFAVLKNHCTTPPPTPSSLNYALPAELDRLVLRLLSKDPSARPSAEELRNHLSDHLGGDR